MYPEESEKELKRTIIDELMHIKDLDFEQYDEESHEREEFREKIREYSKEI